jgi:hypothetical protein
MRPRRSRGPPPSSRPSKASTRAFAHMLVPFLRLHHGSRGAESTFSSSAPLGFRYPFRDDVYFTVTFMWRRLDAQTLVSYEGSAP